jgi:hypothetical protein
MMTMLQVLTIKHKDGEVGEQQCCHWLSMC